MECSHLLDNIKVDDPKVEDSTITKNYSCSECSTTEQNWVCLHCGVVNCGRYVNGHAKLHAESTGHQICMSCDEFSVYCYKCDDYVSNDLDNRIDKIRQQIRKDNGDTCLDNSEYLENANEDKNNISSELNNVSSDKNNVSSEYNNVSSEQNNGSSEQNNVPSEQSNAEDVGNSNGEEIIDAAPSSSSDVSNTSESKSCKIKNIDEPVRSLRPRSRKRTLSDDSSSTENNTKKKPTNGKTIKDKKIVGLKNLGNTCFMNAVLQSLNNIQEFSCYFSQLPSLELKSNGRKVYHSRSYTRQEMHDVVMAEELRKVLISLNTGGCGGKGAISPECLFLVIWKVVPRFRGYQQQDAHEFLRYMLDRLHTELLQLLPPDKDGGFVSRTPSASIVTAVFGGTLQSEVRCLACGTQSKKFDPFLDLSLELPDTGRHDAPVTLHDCLTSFVQVEELADTERYLCSSCKSKQKSTKQFRLRRLPHVLCLHLKRFRWHNYFRTKVDTSITFPLKSLDMCKFVLNNVPETRRSGLGNYLYDLAAVIVHHGSGAGSGHYTAFAINDDQWFHFNDQTVRPVKTAAVESCKPYILFYIRREPTLPTAS